MLMRLGFCLEVISDLKTPDIYASHVRTCKSGIAIPLHKYAAFDKNARIRP